MTLKIFLTYLLLGWQVMAHAQFRITFGDGDICEGSGNYCHMESSGKAPQNSQFTYQPKTQELLIVLDKQKLGKENTDKLLSEQRTKGKMQYRFTYDNPLPPDVVQQLGLKGKVYIKKGVYPIIVTKEAYLLRVTLIFK